MLYEIEVIGHTHEDIDADLFYIIPSYWCYAFTISKADEDNNFLFNPHYTGIL